MSRRSEAKTEPEGAQERSTEREWGTVPALYSHFVRFPCTALAPRRDRATDRTLTMPTFGDVRYKQGVALVVLHIVYVGDSK